MAFERGKLGSASLEAEYVSTQEKLPCVSFPLLTTCVSFLLSAVCALHSLFPLTHLLWKGNASAPGFRSAMEKDGMQGCLESSHNPLLRTSSKSQGEAFLQEGKAHRQKKPVSWGGGSWAHTGAAVTVPTCFAPGIPSSLVLSHGITHVPDHGEGRTEGNNPQSVAKWLPTHLEKPQREDTSHYTPWGLLGSQLCRYQLAQGHILEMTFLSTASAAPQEQILERDKFHTRFPPLHFRFLLSPAQQHDLFSLWALMWHQVKHWILLCLAFFTCESLPRDERG